MNCFRLSVILASVIGLLAPVFAESVSSPLQLSTYATSSSVKAFAQDAAYREAAPPLLRSLHITKIILEVFRGGDIVPPEDLVRVRDYFQAEGFEVWGGIATLPGNGYCVKQEGGYGWLNWQAEKTQRDLLGVMQGVAPIFDTFIVDDFLCTDDKSAESEAARNGREWGEYRRDLLTAMSQKLFIDPMKAANPDSTVIIKFPQWYDRFHIFGYDTEREPQLYDRVWVGTETRGQYTQRFGFTQPYEGFVNYRWLSGIARVKKGGAWFDYGDCDADDFIEQAYQSVLAGAQDLVLFSYAQTADGEPGDEKLREEFEHLSQLAAYVAQHPVTGVPAYKPMNSDPGPDMYLMDFLGMLGMPIVPTHEFPTEAKTIFLPTHAVHDKGLKEKVETALDAGHTVIVTTGLLIARPELCEYAGLDTPLTSSPMRAEKLLVGRKEIALTQPLELESDFLIKNSRLTAMVGDKTVTYFSQHKNGKAIVWILNAHTYDQADFDAVGEVLLSPRQLGILDLPQPALAELRKAFYGGLAFGLDAPSRVCIQALGDTSYAIHNYNNEAVTISLQTPKGTKTLLDLFSNERLAIEKQTAKIELAPRSRIVLTDPEAHATVFNTKATLKNAPVLNPEIHKYESVGGTRYLSCKVSDDPYTNNTTRISLPDLTHYAGQDIVFECTYLDKGAGYIRATLTGASPARMSNYTRLNTGQERRAWFGFNDFKSALSVLEFTDMQYLKSIRILPAQDDAAWQAMDDAVPKKVTSMLTLEKPMQIVTTAGIDVVGDMDTLETSLRNINEIAPLMRVLGFTSIESYVTWKRLEPEQEGTFDFTYYDRIVEKLAEFDLKWFPLLIVGSGYALPEWFIESPENIGFKCLEHGIENPIQSIWHPHHRRHVTRVLQAFGQHYGPMKVLEGVRLGPSGNYGESQYPAGGNWGPKGKTMHIHLGWWAGDDYGAADYQIFLTEKYGDIATLNAKWESTYNNFEEILPRLPEQMQSMHERIDFTQWYTDSMSEWCEWWALEARRALPEIVIHQSAGGWGFRESGTDYTAQTKSMQLIKGGIRLTNETDSLEQDIYATRLACTAARLYGVGLGFEPASSHTARGTVGRIFNTLAANGEHYFTYQGNIISTPLAIQKWLEFAPLFDTRQAPKIEVAVFYPETYNQIDDSAFRHLYAWGFNPRAAEVRRVIDVDYLDERLIRDGFLDRYKALVFCWGNITNADVLEKIDAWVRAGGVVIYPSFPRGALNDENGSGKIFQAWSAGDTGEGRFFRFQGDMEPTELYGHFVRNTLRSMDCLSPQTIFAINLDVPEQVFSAIQEDGNMLLINYTDDTAKVKVPGEGVLKLEPYTIQRFTLP